MMFILLETVHFDSDDELTTLAFGNNSIVRQEMKEKYDGIKLSFQTSSNHNKREYLLNVFECSR